MLRQLKDGREIRRPGFSIAELLTCIVVAVILAAVILPQIKHPRGPGRRTTCLNNLRNLGIAAQSYATTFKGQLPFLVDRNTPINWGTADRPLNAAAPWTVGLLPYIEYGPLGERLLASSNSDTIPAEFQIVTLGLMKIATFNCSEDPDKDVAGNLSYAINTGYIGHQTFGKDVVFDDDAAAFRSRLPIRGHSAANYTYRFNDAATEIARSTGVAWPDAFVTIDEIARRDGVTTTLLFAENLQSQRWAGRAPTSEINPTPTIEYEISDISFGLPIEATGGNVPYVVTDRISNPAAGVGEPAANTDPSKTLVLDPLFTGAWMDTLRDGRINRNIKSAKEGETPRPSSLHAGGVNVIFVGGNGKFLSEEIDPVVYAQLLSWDGARRGQGIVDDTGF